MELLRTDAPLISPVLQAVGDRRALIQVAEVFGFKLFNVLLKETTMKTILALSAALCLGLSAPGFAQTGSYGSSSSTGSMGAPGSSGTSAPAATSGAAAKADIKAMKKQADGDYKAAKAKCKPMKGDEQKACAKDAKAAHEKAKADIKRAEADAKAASKKS